MGGCDLTVAYIGDHARCSSPGHRSGEVVMVCLRCSRIKIVNFVRTFGKASDLFVGGCSTRAWAKLDIGYDREARRDVCRLLRLRSAY